MDLTVLEKMSTEALYKIRDHTMQILANRSMTGLRVGGVGWFLDKQGRKRFLRVERVNAKSVSGREVDEVTLMPLSAFGGQWRVSRTLMNMIGTTPTAGSPKSTAPVSDYTPKSTLGDQW